MQVIDKNGQIRPVVVWRCGEDILFAETMDGLFDSARRYAAPKWLIEALEKLPPETRFNAFGIPYSGEATDAVRPVLKSASMLPDGMEDDDDVDGAEQA